RRLQCAFGVSKARPASAVVSSPPSTGVWNDDSGNTHRSAARIDLITITRRDTKNGPESPDTVFENLAGHRGRVSCAASLPTRPDFTIWVSVVDVGNRGYLWCRRVFGFLPDARYRIANCSWRCPKGCNAV